MIKFIKEEKQLLLTDLSPRVPYGVKANIPLIEGDKRIYTVSFSEMNDFKKGHITIIPYLRTRSSMTEEEKEELRQEQIKDEQLFADCIKNHPEMRGLIIPHFAADWCDKNMIDYRGLIEKGLAFKALDGMYNN